MCKSKSTESQSRKSIVIGVIYRHPGGSYDIFQEQLKEIIHKLNHSYTQLVLVGDYNINVAKQTSDTKVCNYVNEVYSSGCLSLINKPTRITATSATSLDHIYTNSFHRVALAGIITLNISDHLPTFCVIKNNSYKNYLPRHMAKDMKNFNLEAFCNDIINKLKYLPYHSDSDPNLDITNLLNLISETVNVHAPLKIMSRKQMKLKAKPWITKGLLKSITTKNRLFHQCYKQQKTLLI